MSDRDHRDIVMAKNTEEAQGYKAPKSVEEHELECMKPGGGLHELGLKLDALRVTNIRMQAIVGAAVVLIPVALAWWSNRQSNDRLQKQIEVAAEVAKQLKAVQDGRGGRVELGPSNQQAPSAWSFPPAAIAADSPSGPK
jgi:hypothetical protein